MRIAIVYSQPSKRMLSTPYGEADLDTTFIADKVSKGLTHMGHEVELHPINEDSIEKIVDLKADCIFNLIEWCGHDIDLAERAFKYLRMTNLPITGSSEKLFVLTGDKIKMKQALKDIGVQVPWGIGVSSSREIPREVPYPVIVKPHLEHCSIGLSVSAIANDSTTLEKVVKRQISEFDQDVLIEEFIPGRELLVYLIEEEQGVPRILPVVEMLFEGGNPMSFQTYDAKWSEGSVDYKNTYYEQAVLSTREFEILEKNCIKAFKEMGFWGYARFDARLRDGEPYILETNANPSVYDATEDIDNIESEVIEGIKFPDYLQKIVDAAIWHYERGERV